MTTGRNFKTNMEVLVQLQAVETEMEKLQGFLASLPAKLEALEAEREAAGGPLRQEEEKLKEQKKAYRDRESEVRENQGKIQKSEEKLRAVKTNKEYQSSLKEIDDVQARISQIEEEMRRSREDIDQAEKGIASRIAEFKTLAADIDRRKALLGEESEAARAKHGELSAEQERISARVDKDLLQTYRKVKGLVRNQAVVPVRNEVCRGCHMNIPPQRYNELQRMDRLQFCPNCQRIIFWKPEDHPDTAE